MPLVQLPRDRRPAVDADVDALEGRERVELHQLLERAARLAVDQQRGRAAVAREGREREHDLEVAFGERAAGQLRHRAVAVVGEDDRAVLDVEHVPAALGSVRDDHACVARLVAGTAR